MILEMFSTLGSEVCEQHLEEAGGKWTDSYCITSGRQEEEFV